MFITSRGIIYSLLGILFIIVFSSILSPLAAFAFYNIALFAIIFVDFYLTPSIKKIKVERVIDDKLSLGAKNKVIIRAKSISRLRVKLVFKDETPPEFEIDKREIETIIEGYDEAEAEYNVIPTRRGQYNFGSIHVRVSGVLGLAGRQFVINASQPIKVYPNIKEISSYRILARRGHLLEAGLKPSKIYGFGTDFESLRDYQPDDEYKKISWKATARKSRLITSQYQTERSQNIFIAIEAGRMMTSRINKITKLDHAINAALLLAYVAMDKGDNVGLMVFSNTIKTYLPPKRGKKQLNMIIEALYNQEPEIVEPDYGRAMRYLNLKNRKRSLIVMFTDLIDIDVSKAVTSNLKSLYPAHLPLCVAISDPILFEEAHQYPETNLSVYRKATAEDLIFQREQVKNILHKGGVLTLDVAPQKLTPSLISRYLSIKAKNRL